MAGFGVFRKHVKPTLDSCHIEDMADRIPVAAQAAIVREAHGGSQAAVFIVAEPDPAKAREILRGKLPGLHVAELYPLPAGCLETFGLKPGEFTRWLAEGLG